MFVVPEASPATTFDGGSEAVAQSVMTSKEVDAFVQINTYISRFWKPHIGMHNAHNIHILGISRA